MPPTLYFHPIASYCHKALIALYENGVPFSKRLIDLGDARDRAELSAHWPLCKFPVLRDEERDRDVPEATILIEYVERHFPTAARLIPDDADAALDVRLWDRILDNYVHAPMQAIVADRIGGSTGDLAGQRALLAKSYALIDDRMASRTWICCERFTLADCAAAPALFYASTLVPFDAGHAHLATYFERLVARPSVARVLDEAKPYFAMYPFADDLPERFR